MNDGTSVLFGLEDEFRVLQVERVEHDHLRVLIEAVDFGGGCPACGVVSTRVKERPLVRVRDLPGCGQRTELWWRKRRLICAESACGTRTFTQQSDAVGRRPRTTRRLREGVAAAIAVGNRAVSEVAVEYQLSWRTGHKALIAAAARWLPEPEPTRVLGIDETRARSVRWVLDDAGWKRSDPWMTSFVGAETSMPGRLLGLAPGRSGACVRDWLGEQSPSFRAGIELVVIDPSAPYASGVRAALPHARIAVDKWHLVALANQMVTQVRQRATRERLGRRGTTAERVWVNRHLLLTGYEHLSAKQRARLKATLAAEDWTNEVGAAHAVKERLRMLLAETDPDRIRHRLYQFYDAAAESHMDETIRLANTIETWWPAILIALTEDVTNARTEGYNRIIKQTQRVSVNRLRLPEHGQLSQAHTQPHRPHPRTRNSDMTGAAPLKYEDPLSGFDHPTSGGSSNHHRRIRSWQKIRQHRRAGSAGRSGCRPRLRSTRSGFSCCGRRSPWPRPRRATGVDRSTIVRIRTVAKDGALAALAASKPGAGSTTRDSDLAAAQGRGGPVVRGDQGDGGQADVGRGKRRLGLSGQVPNRVDAVTKEALLALLDQAAEAGWSRRQACRRLDLPERRANRWLRRREAERLVDSKPGGSPLHAILAEEAEAILAVFEQWAQVDRSHRKLAHRGSYLGRFWCSPSTVRSDASIGGQALSALAASG